MPLKNTHGSEGNEVVQEVREIREQLWRQGGSNTRGFMELMKKKAAARDAKKPRRGSDKRSA